ELVLLFQPQRLASPLLVLRWNRSYLRFHLVEGFSDSCPVRCLLGQFGEVRRDGTCLSGFHRALRLGHDLLRNTDGDTTVRHTLRILFCPGKSWPYTNGRFGRRMLGATPSLASAARRRSSGTSP